MMGLGFIVENFLNVLFGNFDFWSSEFLDLFLPAVHGFKEFPIVAYGGLSLGSRALLDTFPDIACER